MAWNCRYAKARSSSLQHSPKIKQPRKLWGLLNQGFHVHSVHLLVPQHLKTREHWLVRAAAPTCYQYVKFLRLGAGNGISGLLVDDPPRLTTAIPHCPPPPFSNLSSVG